MALDPFAVLDPPVGLRDDTRDRRFVLIELRHKLPFHSPN